MLSANSPVQLNVPLSTSCEQWHNCRSRVQQMTDMIMQLSGATPVADKAAPVGRQNQAWIPPEPLHHVTTMSAQSNLRRGPRRHTVAHTCCKVPIGYNGAPEIRLQKYPFPWTDPQTPPPASSLDPSDLWCQMASGSDPPFFHNVLDNPMYRQSDAPTHRPTDCPRESLITIGRCAPRATRPNNTNISHDGEEFFVWCNTISFVVVYMLTLEITTDF